MSTLLHLDSSVKGDHSVTHGLTEHFATKWREAVPQGKVIRRDLATSNLPFLNGNIIQAFFTPQEALTAEQKKLTAPSDELIAELFEADTYVFGVPMYNFTVSALLKTYIDLIVRKDKTFAYESGKPEGLLKNKKLYVATSSGWDYSPKELNHLDFVHPYVQAIFPFIGITDISVIATFGQDPEAVKTHSDEAKKEIDKLINSIRTGEKVAVN